MNWIIVFGTVIFKFRFEFKELNFIFKNFIVLKVNVVWKGNFCMEFLFG